MKRNGTSSSNTHHGIQIRWHDWDHRRYDYDPIILLIHTSKKKKLSFLKIIQSIKLQTGAEMKINLERVRVVDGQTSDKAPVVRIERWEIRRGHRSRDGRGVAAIGKGMVTGKDEGGRRRRSLRNRQKPPSCYSQHICSISYGRI